jgi:putative ABC transport system substrate-binding protein
VNPKGVKVSDATAPLSVKPTEEAAEKLQVKVETFGVHGERDFPEAVAAALKANVQAIALTSNPLFDIAGQQIAELALQNNLATISFANTFPGLGGLLSYGPNILAEYHHAAYFAARIIRGARRADILVEQPIKYSLSINLKTARALNLKAPEMLLASSDEVIE